VFHRSTKQKTVSTSAMQAEVATLFESIPYITWFRDLLDELGCAIRSPVKSCLFSPIYDTFISFFQFLLPSKVKQGGTQLRRFKPSKK
jgi:hypothetical protein